MAVALSEEDDRKVRAVFACWDADKDGVWDEAEARAMQRETDGSALEAAEWQALCKYLIPGGCAPWTLGYREVREMYERRGEFGTNLERDHAVAVAKQTPTTPDVAPAALDDAALDAVKLDSAYFHHIVELGHKTLNEAPCVVSCASTTPRLRLGGGGGAPASGLWPSLFSQSQSLCQPSTGTWTAASPLARSPPTGFEGPQAPTPAQQRDDIRRLQEETNLIISSTSKLLRSLSESGGDPSPRRPSTPTRQSSPQDHLLRTPLTPGALPRCGPQLDILDAPPGAQLQAARLAGRLGWAGPGAYISVRVAPASYIETPDVPARFATLAEGDLRAADAPRHHQDADADGACVFVLASAPAAAVSLLRCGLQPVSPTAQYLCQLGRDVRPVAGVGFRVAGRDVAAAFDRAHALHAACELQLLALGAAGGDPAALALPPLEAAAAGVPEAFGPLAAQLRQPLL